MPNPEPVIYQLKVALQGISPMIWRRLLVCDDNTIADLHYIIQIAMGWSDDHLHQFRIHGKRYGIARMGGVSFSDDPDTVRFMELRQHYSRYHIMGRLLDIIEDGTNQEYHQDELEALQYWFQIDSFDRKRANRRLYDYARGENVFAWV